MGKEAFSEMAELLGKVCGSVVKELGSAGKPLVEGFKRGWQQAMQEEEPVATRDARQQQESR